MKGQKTPISDHTKTKKQPLPSLVGAVFLQADNLLISNKASTLRKVSAHGLGHLMPPYRREGEADMEGAQPWQQDLWLEIINAALEGRQPDYTRLQNFDMPAISRYGATTPELLKWFDGYNENKEYSDTVRPFNFLLSMQAKPGLQSLKPVSPYDKNPAKALARGFDRATGDKISKSQLKTYLDAIAQYHLHPETKFLNGDYLDHGKTRRRHIDVKSVQHIGKEANKWEEQFFLGVDPEEQIEYGMSQEQENDILEEVIGGIATYGAKRIADTARLSARYVLDVGNGNSKPSEKVLSKLYTSVQSLKRQVENEDELRREVKQMMDERQVSIRSLAAALETDPSNLAKVLSGGRNARDWLIRANEYLLRLI